MARYVQRGLEQDQEQNYARLIRDTRTLGQRFADFFKNSEAVTITIVVLAIVGFFLPAGVDYFFIAGVLAFVSARSYRAVLPFRLPKISHAKDYNSPKPGTFKPSLAQGIYFFGNEKKDNAELWFTNEDMRTHVLMFGSTGSGKTESMISIAYNALLQSSGFIYVDGKGDNALFSKIFAMVRSLGREDDLLLINFMTGARDIVGPQKRRLSNTMNPFANGSSSMLSQLVVSMMDESSDSPSGDMWKGRAIAFVEALMKLLVAMRDAEFMLLDANTVRKYFELPRLEAIVLDRVFPRDNQEAIDLNGFPDVVTEPIINYVLNLPGYNKDKKGKQVSQVLEQHGFITMQLVRVFTSLADTYGHIMRTRLAEVDLKDVVLNRRILTVLLPALEKSPDELSNLGKVIIASIKAMMAAGLGEEVEGKYKDVITKKPTNAKTPFLCILDEYGYYAVKGFAIVPAQARSLGFSVVFAGQDLPALQKASKEEAATIGANTNIKICMKLEDPLETWDFFMKTGGESYVSHVSGFQTDSRSVTNQYMDTRSAQMEKRQRVDLLDLKEQDLGEAHIFFKSKIVRARMFYANPPEIHEMRLNQFVQVAKPFDVDVRRIVGNFKNFEKIIKDGEFFVNVDVPDDKELSSLITNLHKDEKLPPIEKGVQTLMAYHERLTTVDIPSEESERLPTNELNIFAGLRQTEFVKSLMLAKDVAEFSQPVLDRAATREQIALVERLDGKLEHQALSVAQEIIKDMDSATHYPPQIIDRPTGGELAQLANNIVAHINLKKNTKNDGATVP